MKPKKWNQKWNQKKNESVNSSLLLYNMDSVLPINSKINASVANILIENTHQQLNVDQGETPDYGYIFPTDTDATDLTMDFLLYKKLYDIY